METQYNLLQKSCFQPQWQTTANSVDAEELACKNVLDIFLILSQIYVVAGASNEYHNVYFSLGKYELAPDKKQYPSNVFLISP